MSRQYSIALLAISVVYAVALAWPSGLNITKHTGDALHLVAIVERMAQGELPHLDFMTPIGALAFSPIVGLVELGLPIGRAFLLAQLGVALVLVPLTIWTLARRVPGWAVFGFAVLSLILSVALVHGEASPAVSVSMHYNRWAWAIGFVVLAMAAFAPQQTSPLDGVIAGGLIAALAMIKVTYFVALAPLAVVFALLTGQTRMILGAIGTGLIIAALITVVHGVGYWDAYLADLLAVSGSEGRAKPGLDYTEILLQPAYIAGTLITLAAGLGLRSAGLRPQGIMVILLLPAGTYVTFQNFGNDPQWVLFAALLLAVWLPQTPAPQAGWLRAGAVALVALSAGSYTNMALSPLRHAMIPDAQYTPVLAGSDLHQDLRVSKLKANRSRANQRMDGLIAIDAYTLPAPGLFQGHGLTDCYTDPVPAYYTTITDDLRMRGLAQGGRIFVMDVLSPFWLYGDHQPLRAGAPWYYAGLSGLADATHVLLPKCAILAPIRNQIARDLAETPLQEIADTPHYVLFVRP